jgi:hypothetical protein
MNPEKSKRRSIGEWMKDNSWWVSLIFGSGIVFGIFKLYTDSVKEDYTNRLAQRELFWRSEVDKNQQIAQLSRDIAVSRAEKMASDKVEQLEEKLKATSSRLLNATESITVKLGRDTVFAADFLTDSDNALRLREAGSRLFYNGALFPELKPPYWNMQTGVSLTQVSSFITEQTIKLGPEDESLYKTDPGWWPLFTIFTHEEKGVWIVASVGSISKAQLPLFVEKIGGFDPGKANMMSRLPIGYLGAFLSTAFFVSEKSSVSEVDAIAVKEDAYFISSVCDTPEGKIKTDFIVIDAGGSVFCVFLSYYGYDILSPAVVEARSWLKEAKFVK